MILMNNTHYNYIDALIFAMGKDAFGKLYGGWRGLDVGTAESFSNAFSVPMPVASVLVECFVWAEKENWMPWNTLS